MVVSCLYISHFKINNEQKGLNGIYGNGSKKKTKNNNNIEMVDRSDNDELMLCVHCMCTRVLILFYFSISFFLSLCVFTECEMRVVNDSRHSNNYFVMFSFWIFQCFWCCRIKLRSTFVLLCAKINRFIRQTNFFFLLIFAHNLM